jgi:hypothetical protein
MRRTAVFFGAFLIVAAPIAGTALHSSANRAARAEFSRLAEDLPGLTALTITADPWRQEATIEGLTFRRVGLGLRVGRLTLPFAAPQPLFASAAYAQDSEKGGGAGDFTSGVRDAASMLGGSGTISAENIEMDVGAAHYTIKSIELSGTTLSKADLDQILDPKSTLSAADRIGKFAAAQIVIPEIAMQTTLGSEIEKDTYSDVKLKDVAQGRVGEATIGNLSSNFTSPEAGAVRSAYGPMRMTGFDLSLATRIVSEGRKSDTEQRKTMYDSLDIESGKIVMQKSNLEIDMGALSAKDVKGRPLRIPPTSAAAMFARHDADHDKQANAFVADVLESFEIGAFEVKDLRFTVTDKDGSGIGTVDRVYLSRMADLKIGEAGFDNLVVKSAGLTVKIDGVAFRGIDLGKLRDLAENATGDPAPPNEGANASPVGEMLLTGLDVDLADTKREDGRHTRFRLANLGLRSADPVGGIPTHFTTTVDHFTLDLKDLPGGQWDDVVALGYDKLDLSSRLEAHFDPPKRELGLDDLSLSGMDMGAVKIAGSFANVSKDLFSTDQAQIEAAALSILVDRIELKVENTGLFERLIAAAAKKDNKSPDEIRETYVAAAAIGVPSLLGDGPGAKAVGAAIAKFIAAPKNLRIVAVAPDGLGVGDLALMKEPNALMNKLSVEAAANE